MLQFLAAFIALSASVAANAVIVNYQIGIANFNNQSPYNYCSAKQNALVDVIVSDGTNGSRLKTFPLVPLSYKNAAYLSFSAAATVPIEVEIVPRQSEYGFGLPTDPASCDPSHQINVPLAIGAEFSLTDADGNARLQSSATALPSFFYSGTQSDPPGSVITVPALPLILDAACETYTSCTGQKITNVNGRGYVSVSGATATSGLVLRHGLVADGISTLILQFPTTNALRILSFGEILSPYTQGGPGAGAGGLIAPPVTSSLPCPLGMIFNIGSQVGQCKLPIDTSAAPAGVQNMFAFQAPIDFPDGTVVSRNNVNLVGPTGETRGIELSVFDTPDSSSVSQNAWSIVLDLARPPVILVHGLWSNSGTWSQFVGYAFGDGNYDLSRRLSFGLPDYRGDIFASNTFSPAAKPYSVSVVEQAINDGALATERAAGFAASAVDVIGHSMGSLQVRSLVAGGGQLSYARADNYFAGSVHKLITLGTPHFGAPIARELMKNRCATSPLLQTLTTYTYDTGFGAGFSLTPPHPITTFEQYLNDFGGGAVYFGPALQDLQPGSSALMALNATPVPTHLIASDIGAAAPPHFAFTLADYAATAIFSINIDTAAALGPPSDDVVPLTSQLSGFSSTDAATTVLTGLRHDQETGDLQSYKAIDLSLRSGIVSPGLLAAPFVSQLPAPTSDGGTNYSFAACPRATVAGVAASASVQAARRRIAAASASPPTLIPASGTVVSVGQSVTIAAQLQGAMKADFIFNNAVLPGTGAAGSFSATIQIPPGILGRVPFSAVLNDGSGNITQLNSFLVVGADLTGAIITASPLSVTLAQVGNAAAVLAVATLPNGTVLPFDSTVPGVSYSVASSGSSRNVIITNGNTVSATRKGQSTLTISAAGSAVTIPVTVLSNGFTNQATSSLPTVYKNITDPRTVTLTVPLPGDLATSDINVSQVSLAGAGVTIPVSWGSLSSSSPQLTFQTTAANIAAALPVGLTSLSLTGQTQDGAVWTSTTSMQVNVGGAIVPDLVGSNQSNASATLANSGLSVGTVSQTSSKSADIGIILSESPQAGSVVDTTTPIMLAVSSGVVVPNTVSATQAMASNAIIGAGLAVGNVTQQSSSSVPSGSVISQSPASGTNVNPASSVNLTVSSGPPAGKSGGGALDAWTLYSLLGLTLLHWRRRV